MNSQIEVHDYLCFPSIFTINGKNADYNDFGEKYDRDPENAEECGNMQFNRIEATKEVLEKYSITKDEYSKICDELEVKLSFGCCGECS